MLTFECLNVVNLFSNKIKLFSLWKLVQIVIQNYD